MGDTLNANHIMKFILGNSNTKTRIQVRIRRRKASDVKGFSVGGKGSINPESADAGSDCRPSLEVDTGMLLLDVRIGSDKARGERGSVED